MRNRVLLSLLILVITCFPALLLGAGNPASADTGTAKADTLNRRTAGVAVTPFGSPIFHVYTRVGPLTPEERAKAIEAKIVALSRDPFYTGDSLRLVAGEFTYDILYGSQIISSVTREDALAERTSQEFIAKSRRAKIAYAIRHYRTETSKAEIIKNLIRSTGVIALFILLIYLVNKLFKWLRRRAEVWFTRIMERMKLGDNSFFNPARQVALLTIVLRSLKWLILLLLFFSALLLIFYLMPWTKIFSIKIIGFVVDPLRDIISAFWHYIPNLITIGVILFVARIIIKLFRFLSREVESGTLRIPGFYPDWALPTFNIIRVGVVLFTIVGVWPYLPGSGSQVFQGVSVLFGLVFSLTSASALSNFVAGLTITYTRAFRIGDRVRIGDVVGDITEKSMLVTKVRTIKNEEITVPNTKIMSTEVINYSTCAPSTGLIIHTSVTIGYDAPWREVHRLLIEAAGKTEFILNTPSPFVLQTALNDFYISYQVNAYTRHPNQMAEIMSRLHQNIQDSFNKAGVEIMSPHYNAMRDGNTIAIPEENRPQGYEAPRFRVEK